MSFRIDGFTKSFRETLTIKKASRILEVSVIRLQIWNRGKIRCIKTEGRGIFDSEVKWILGVRECDVDRELQYMLELLLMTGNDLEG